MRFRFIDLLKCILIIFVVIGHDGSFYKEYIYVFHMPAFFIISGLFLPSLKEKSISSFVLAKSKTLLIPYLVFLILVGVSFYNQEPNFWLKSLIGGRSIYGMMSPFWFISCLFFAFCLYALLEKLDNWLKILFLLLFYVISIMERGFIHDYPQLFYTPLCIDISFMAVIYLYIGKTIKGRLFELVSNKKAIILTAFTSITLVVLSLILLEVNGYQYYYDMKYAFYAIPGLNLLIPTLCFLFLFSVSVLLGDKCKWLETIGRASLIIMFLHMIILKSSEQLPSYVSIILSIILPVFVYLLLDKFVWTKRLLLGKWK